MPIPPGWSYEQTIANLNGISNTNNVARLSLSPTGNFPFQFNLAKVSGADIRIYDTTSNTSLNYWIKNYKSNGAVLYFQYLDSSHNHSIYYGNSGASAVSNFGTVFSTGTGFDGGIGISLNSTGVSGEAYYIGEASSWNDSRYRAVYRRMSTPQIAGTVNNGVDGGSGVRDLSITTDPSGRIVPDSQGNWVGYYGSTPYPGFPTSPARTTFRCVSADSGLTWTNHTRVLYADNNNDGGGIMPGSVIKVANNLYYMWCTASTNGSGLGPGGIELATSTDNTNWTKQGLIIPATTGGIIDYVAGSVAVPHVRLMRDGKWTMFTESRVAGQGWHIVGFSANSPSGNWTVMNAGHTVLDSGNLINWGSDGFANPFVDELDDGSGYLMFTNGHTNHDVFANFNFQAGFLRSTSYSGGYVTEIGNPSFGRQTGSYGVETGALAIDPNTNERVIFIQPYYASPTTSPFSDLYKVWPILDRGALLVSRTIADAAVIGCVLPTGNFIAESASWMTTHSSEDSSPYILSVIDSGVVPSPGASVSLNGRFRLNIRRTTFANSSPGDIQFVYYNSSDVPNFFNGVSWTTSTVSASTSDTNRQVLASIADDGNNYIFKALYTDDYSTIVSGSINKSSVKSFTTSQRALLAGDLFTNAFAGGTFFRQISSRPYVSNDPIFALGSNASGTGTTVYSRSRVLFKTSGGQCFISIY